MSILPPATTPPYDSAEYTLNLLRVLGNDAMQGLAGDLLSDTRPYTLVFLNAGYRYVQKKLAINGGDGFLQEAIIPAITPVPSNVIDPATQVYIDYGTYFDGFNYNTSPVLPQNLILPLRLWERPTGSLQNFIPMFPVNDGLPSRRQSSNLVEWEWRANTDGSVALWMVGALQTNDIRMRFRSFLPDIGGASDPVRIFRGAEAVAYATLYKYAESRGSPLVDSLRGSADVQIQDLVTDTNRKTQRGNHRRMSYSRRSHAGWGSW